MSNETIKIGLPSRERKFADSFEESQTIQDDALSLREILVRFSSGQPLPSVVNNQEGYPLGDMEDSDFSFGDTSDIVDLDHIKASSFSVVNRFLEDSKKVQPNVNQPNEPIEPKLNEPPTGKNSNIATQNVNNINS